MTPYPTPRSWRRLWDTHSLLIALFAVGAAFALFAVINAILPIEGGAVETTVAPLQAPLRMRCETCGVIEAIRKAEQVEGAPPNWVFSVRLRDGSLRQTTSIQPGSWEVGDGMQLLGGGLTWSAVSP